MTTVLGVIAPGKKSIPATTFRVDVPCAQTITVPRRGASDSQKKRARFKQQPRGRHHGAGGTLKTLLDRHNHIGEALKHIIECSRKGWLTKLRTNAKVRALECRGLQAQYMEISNEYGRLAQHLEDIANG